MGRATSAEAEMGFRAEDSGWCQAHELPGAGGLRGACSWLLSGCLTNKLCGPGSAHTESKHHVAGWNVPWNCLEVLGQGPDCYSPVL